MLKTIANMLVGAFMAAMVGAAFAVVGQAPVPGFQTPDGSWLLGLAAGSNFSYQYAIVAKASGTQTTCTNIVPGIYLAQVDTVVTGGDSICLPFAVAGTNLNIRNNGAQSMNVFAQAGTNLLTASTDQINNITNTSAIAVTAQQIMECFAAKNGSWSCARGS